MTDALAHRGPDGQGSYLERSVGLGHRRLAILDLSPAGHQPMSYSGGRYWITFNGEIYNFLELQNELRARGYAFTTSSDTEVILAAFDAWGYDCLPRFNGMWAFAIWDAQDRRLFLARDRFGIKPLFFVRQPGWFAFASEMKAFLKLPDFRAEVDLPALKAELLDIHSLEGSDRCLLHNVQRLRPGHLLILSESGDLQVRRWWQTLDHLVRPPQTLPQQTEQFLALFEDACRLRMRSDVPIGTSLSGGLDSSSVVCTLARIAGQSQQRQANDWQRAFVATFPGTAVDERPYAEKVIERTGVRPIYVEISREDTFDLLSNTAFHCEQLVNSPLASLWQIYQRQRQEGVVVTLDGHGGDELLAGYPTYTVEALYDTGSWPGLSVRYLQLLSIYQGLNNSPADTGPKTPTADMAWMTHSWLRNIRRVGKRFGLARGGVPPSTAAERWLGPALAEVAPAPPTPATAVPQASLFRRALYRDFHETILPLILRNYDRMSMAHGVEVRMPFLDWRLVTFAFSLPPESLLGQGYTKLVLRRAMQNIVPAPILERRDKIGFASPLSFWLRNGGQRRIEELVHEPAFLASPYWNGPGLAEAATTLGAGSSWNHISSLWIYLHLYRWLQAFTGQGVYA